MRSKLHSLQQMLLQVYVALYAACVLVLLLTNVIEVAHVLRCYAVAFRGCRTNVLKVLSSPPAPRCGEGRDYTGKAVHRDCAGGAGPRRPLAQPSQPES